MFNCWAWGGWLMHGWELVLGVWYGHGWPISKGFKVLNDFGAFSLNFLMLGIPSKKLGSMWFYPGMKASATMFGNLSAMQLHQYVSRSKTLHARTEGYTNKHEISAGEAKKQTITHESRRMQKQTQNQRRWSKPQNCRCRTNAQRNETHKTSKKTVNLNFRYSKISKLDTSLAKVPFMTRAGAHFDCSHPEPINL